ncbi:uncharacterized protein LOC132395919 [Hypanus sabinus]|uniref:uncharacterized protein LOC132395919 n=1 Tax=Hypanus sabinus TaxID=79690 RepID=UPI0028C3B2C3|nr:uncharacterized protein LOC132395919 [Hypanus sabinus]
MAFLCAGGGAVLRRDRNAGDRTGRFMVGGGRRNNSGSTKADGRQGPVVRSETCGRRGPPGVGVAPRPCPPTLGRDASNRAVAVEWEPRLPLLPVRGNARWGAAKVGGRVVGRFSQILAVLPFYSPVVKPVSPSPAETPGKKHLSLKPSEMGGDCAPCAWTLSDTYTFKGFPSRGDGWCWHPLFFQGVNENYHSGLWIRTFQRLISSKTYALLQNSSRYSHFYSSMKALQQCRMYGNYKGDGNAALFPGRSKTVYYDILKVSPNATHNQIKSAYYKQSFIYHPDRNAGSEKAALKFTQISEAYSVLGSVSLRKKYDRGILTPADLHVAKKPSSKVHASTIKQTQSGSSEGNLNDGKSKFDFDEFYRAHYGKQLEMEQLMRRRRMQLLKSRDSLEERLNLQRLVELSMIAMLIAGLAILCNLK